MPPAASLPPGPRRRCRMRRGAPASPGGSARRRSRRRGAAWQNARACPPSCSPGIRRRSRGRTFPGWPVESAAAIGSATDGAAREANRSAAATGCSCFARAASRVGCLPRGARSPTGTKARTGAAPGTATTSTSPTTGSSTRPATDCSRGRRCARENWRGCTGTRSHPGRASHRTSPPSWSASGPRCAKVPPGNKLRRLHRRLPMNVRTSLLGVLCAFALSPAANAWDRGEATTFARLPNDRKNNTGNPEGITVDKHGNVYVTQFDPFGDRGPIGKLIIFDEDGRLLTVVSVQGSSSALLGLDFHPTTHELLVIDFGQQQVLSVDDFKTGAAHLFTQV